MYYGSLVALVTPMNESGEVEFDVLAELVEWHISEGTQAIIAVGTTGESATLDFDEHIKVIERVVAVANQRLPIIAGTGANSTREALELTQAAKNAGADACLLVTPYYNRPTQLGLYRHYRLLAESVSIPQILYNVPKRTGCDLLPETVAQLSQIPNIIGIKEASTLERLYELLKLEKPHSFQIYSGDDPFVLPAMQAGAAGIISVSANVAPRKMRQLIDAISQNLPEAALLDSELQSLHNALFVEPNPIPTKWALHRMGKIGPGIRLPLTPLSETHHDAVTSTLKSLDLL